MITQPTLYLTTALAAFLVGSAGESHAAVIFDNFGPGDSFNNGVAYRVSGPSSSSEVDFALGFVPTANFLLDSVEVPLLHSSGSTDVHVRIAADDGSGLPQTTWLDEIVVTAPNVTATIVTADFDNSLTLVAGETYWVWLSAPGDGFSF